MQSLIDPVGNKTIWVYNLLGRVSREIITLNKKIVTRFFCYDANGNIVTKIDRNNRVTSWTYDKLNRVTSEIWHDSWRSFIDNKPPIKKFMTTYTNKGKIESTEDGDNKFTFSYGLFGNELKQMQNVVGFDKTFTFYFTHDINDFKIEKTLALDRRVLCFHNYALDALNHPILISQTNYNDEIKSLIIRYDNFGQITQQLRFADDRFVNDQLVIETKNRYDDAGRLINISHVNNNKTYADYDLTWDAGNRITDFNFTYLNGPAKKNESKYRYDKTSQLINANYNLTGNEMYNFDLNGNRKKADIQGKNESYKTGEYNRLLSDENYRYEYDAEGNRIAKISKDEKTTKYFWDHRNQLTKVQTPTETVNYIYDYQNRLTVRKQDKNETIFIHDEWQVILTFDLTKRFITEYFWGSQQDELICYGDNWTLGDHLNTIRDIIKSDGTVVSHLGYNAFGKLISETKNELFFFGYTGKLFDQSSELQWNINRWYDSKVGRWMSEDPIGFKGKDINIFRYTGNDILNKIDSMGLWSYVQGLGYFNGTLDPLKKDEIGEEANTYGNASSSFRLEFVHDHNSFQNKSCETIKFIQIYYAEFNTYRPNAKLTTNKWVIDAKETAPYYPHSVFAHPTTSISATLNDDPHFGSLHQYRSNYLSLKLETCAVCASGQDKGEVYACLEWGHRFDIGSGCFKSLKNDLRYVNLDQFGLYSTFDRILPNGQKVHYGGFNEQTYPFFNVGKAPTDNMKPFLNQYFP
jgi:RHS repeat-associated protein